MAHAFVWRSGVIGIARHVPRGAVLLAAADARRLKRELSALARHAYDGQTLLVPGVPEAETDTSALEAVKQFAARLQRALDRGARPGGLV